MTISKKIFLTGLTAILVSSLAFTQAAPMPKMNGSGTFLLAKSIRNEGTIYRNAVFKPLDDVTWNALHEYTLESGAHSASEINKYLRTGSTKGLSDPDGVVKSANIIHSYLKNNTKIQNEFTLYRGSVDFLGGKKITSLEQINNVKQIVDKGFTSTSTDIGAAKYIANLRFDENVSKLKFLEEIKLVKGTHGLNITNLSYFNNEKEFLLDKGTKRIITGFDKLDDGFVHVYERTVTEAEEQAIKRSSKLISAKASAFSIDGVFMTKKAQRQLTKITKGALENKVHVGSSVKKKAVGTLKAFAKKHPRTMKFCSGVLKSAPIIIEVAMDLYDMYKEVDKYYSGQFTKRNLAISLAGVAGGIAGGAAGGWLGVKAGAAIGSLIAPGVGTAIGSIVGGIIGGFAGYELGSYLGKNLMAMATAKYHSTMQSNYYFNNLCNNIAEDCEKKNLKPISA